MTNTLGKPSNENFFFFMVFFQGGRGVQKLPKKVLHNIWMAHKIMNPLFYADELVLLCPSYKGLRELLDICDK